MVATACALYAAVLAVQAGVAVAAYAHIGCAAGGCCKSKATRCIHD